MGILEWFGGNKEKDAGEMAPEMESETPVEDPHLGELEEGTAEIMGDPKGADKGAMQRSSEMQDSETVLAKESDEIAEGVEKKIGSSE